MKITGVSQSSQNSAVTARKTASAGFSAVLRGSLSASADLDGIFTQASETYDVPENLLKAVAKAESGFNANATSGCGAMGIMQLMPATAKSLGVTDAYNPYQNIMGGARYLSRLLKNYNGNTTLAVAAYNAGGGAVAKYNGVPPYAETRAYVKKVLDYAGMDLTAGSVSDSSGTSGSAAASAAGEAIAGLSGGSSSGSADTALLSSLLSAAGSGTDSGKAMQELMLSALLEMQMSDSSDDIFSV